VTKIQAEWLKTPLARAVVEALGADNIKFVGGAVRDTLVGRKVADIDAATRYLPEKTKELLETAGLKVIPTGLKHGTVTAVLGREMMEITTLRIDVETDGRHAEVTFTNDWFEDAKRRDFTFNALYAAPDGTLYDPFEGTSDLYAGRVRFIRDAVTRIEEDALRILRFFRFFARYGKGEPDSEAVAACNLKKQLIRNLSIERVRDELVKLLSVPSPLPTIKLMEQSGILVEFMGANTSLDSLTSYLVGERATKRELVYNPLARLYFLLRSSFDAKEIARRFRLSNKERNLLKNMEAACAAAPFFDKVQVRRACYLWGSEATDAAIIAGGAPHSSMLEAVQTWDRPIFMLCGKDMIEAGVQAGPQMGALLKKLEQDWINSDFSLSREALLARLPREKAQ